METTKSSPVTIEEKRPSEDRIVLLSDGVFAIAMTLLILDIRLPEVLSQHAITFQEALQSLFPKILSYMISFLMISSYWSIHRRIINSLKRIDLSFIRINLLLLFFVTALPIPTTFTFQNAYADPFHLSTIIYTLTLALNGLTLAALWMYAAGKHRLVDPKLGQDAINRFLANLLVSPVIFILSLLLLFLPVDPTIVYYSWLSIAVVFFFMRRFRSRLFPKMTEPA